MKRETKVAPALDERRVDARIFQQRRRYLNARQFADALDHEWDLGLTGAAFEVLVAWCEDIMDELESDA